MPRYSTPLFALNNVGVEPPPLMNSLPNPDLQVMHDMQVYIYGYISILTGQGKKAQKTSMYVSICACIRIYQRIYLCKDILNYAYKY